VIKDGITDPMAWFRTKVRESAVLTVQLGLEHEDAGDARAVAARIVFQRWRLSTLYQQGGVLGPVRALAHRRIERGNA
jgi:hypothetical protein